jgi:hypothetical protein
MELHVIGFERNTESRFLFYQSIQYGMMLSYKTTWIDYRLHDALSEVHQSLKDLASAASGCNVPIIVQLLF